MKIIDVEPIIKELYKIGDEKDEMGEHEFALGIDTVIYLLEQAEELKEEAEGERGDLKKSCWASKEDIIKLVCEGR